VHDGHVDEHVIAVSADNPVSEALVKVVKDGDHAHSADDAEHPRIQHGDHFDYLHNGRLHALHDGHVDDHGKISIVN
ncbi:MAG: hypothetical protein AAGJ87_06470, partial [Pseudomonadota bacterium]